MKILLDEQETTISFCRVEDKTMFTKFDKLCSQAPDFYECREVARDKDSGQAASVVSDCYHKAEPDGGTEGGTC